MSFKRFIILNLLLFTVLLGCDTANKKTGDGGGIKIKLPGGSDSRSSLSLYTSRSFPSGIIKRSMSYNTVEDIYFYTLEITGNDVVYSDIIEEADPGQEVIFQDLYQGNYSLKITAYKRVSGNPDLAIFGGSNNDITVYPLQTTPATVVLRDLIGDSSQTDSPPWRPTYLTTAELSSTEVKLTWEDNSFIETGFKVYKITIADSDYVLLADLGSDSTTFTDATYDTSNEPAWYRVCAYNDIGDSDYITVHLPNEPISVLCEDGHPTYPCATSTTKLGESRLEN